MLHAPSSLLKGKYAAIELNVFQRCHICARPTSSKARSHVCHRTMCFQSVRLKRDRVRWLTSLSRKAGGTSKDDQMPKLILRAKLNDGLTAGSRAAFAATHDSACAPRLLVAVPAKSSVDSILSLPASLLSPSALLAKSDCLAKAAKSS